MKTLIAATVITVLLAAPVVGQQTSDRAALEKRVAELERKMEGVRGVLEKLLDLIQAAHPEAAGTPGANPKPAGVNNPDAPLVKPKTGLELVDIKMRIVEKNDVYSKIAWQAVLRNNDAQPTVITLLIQFTDRDDFVLDEQRVRSVRLAGGESKTVSDSHLLGAELARQLHSIQAKASIAR